MTIEPASGAGVASCFLMCPSGFSSALFPFIFPLRISSLPLSETTSLQYKPYTCWGAFLLLSPPGTDVPVLGGFRSPKHPLAVHARTQRSPRPRAVNNPCGSRAISGLDGVQNS